MSVLSLDLCKAANFDHSKSVLGVGGAQQTGEPVPCSLELGPHEFQDYPLRPIDLPGKSRTVILGRDFMSQFKSTRFDWANNRIQLDDEWILLMTEPRVPQKPAKVMTKNYRMGESLTQHRANEIKGLIDSFKVFATNNRAPEECTLGMHAIRSMDDVVSKGRARRIPLCDLPIVKEQVGEMLKNNIIQESTSPFNSNILLVKKDDGSKRFVLDFKNLNKNTKQDSYPLPNVEEMLEKMHGYIYTSRNLI